MTISPLHAALIVCELSNETVNALVMPKILYLINMVYMGNNCGDIWEDAEPLVNEVFVAGEFGPELPSLQDKFSIFYNDYLRMHKISWMNNTPIDRQSKEFVAISRGLDVLLGEKYSTARIYGQCLGAAWVKNYQRGVPNKIPKAAILQEYFEKHQTLFDKNQKV